MFLCDVFGVFKCFPSLESQVLLCHSSADIPGNTHNPSSYRFEHLVTESTLSWFLNLSHELCSQTWTNFSVSVGEMHPGSRSCLSVAILFVHRVKKHELEESSGFDLLIRSSGSLQRRRKRMLTQQVYSEGFRFHVMT